MATNQTTPAVKTAKPKKDPIALVQRIHSQLTTGVLKQKLSAADISLLESHLAKLKSIVS